MTPLAPIPPVPATAAPAAPQVRAGPTEGAPVAPPLLGKAAVTAPETVRPARHDPRPASDGPARLEPPADPPPVKGLGIPPLNTRIVGDGDRVETPPPPPRGTGYASDAIAATPAAPRLDLRR